MSRAARGIAGRAALPRAGAFWLVAGLFFLLFFAAAAPSPLYGVYQAQWRFSAITLTAVPDDTTQINYAFDVDESMHTMVTESVDEVLGRISAVLAEIA